MIELRIDKDGAVCNGHTDILCSIAMVEAAKAAGIPIQGILIAKGIERGTLMWFNESDIDGDVWVIRWLDDGEKADKKLPVTGRGQGRGYSWIRYGLQADEDEL
jgi:hypothetical protein